MLEVGDKVLLLPVKGGGYVALKSDPVKVGDKVVIFPLSNGENVIVKPSPVEVGDKVVIITTKSGERIVMKYVARFAQKPTNSIELSNELNSEFKND